jgi:hypothetical protein
LVIRRQVIEFDLTEADIWRRQFDQSIGQLLIERIPTKAANNEGNGEGVHGD